MARGKRRGRPVNGILVLDKPATISSNFALQQIKRLFNAAKAGHTGSLDPLATGVLPLCFGEATKFSQYLLDADKVYTSTFVLGAQSSTEDADGVITPVADASAISQNKVLETLRSFEGEQKQIPPMYSALKHQGRRLYELAREGQEVERKARTIFIHSLELIAFRSYGSDRPELEIDIKVRVSKGTYIRSIAADLGRKLGVGGYVSKLRRVQAGPFVEADMVPVALLQELKQDEHYAEMDALLMPMDCALSHIPSVRLDQSSGFYLRRGQAVMVPDVPSRGIVKLMLMPESEDLESDEFVGIGEITEEGLVAPRRLVVV